MNDDNMHKISFVGLGKLGCGMFICLASRGHKMLGIDTNWVLIEKMKNGTVPYDEPLLEQMLNGHKQNIEVTDSYAGIADTDVTFMMLPTPSDIDGDFSNRYLVDAIEKVGKNIPINKPYHLVVVSSTVIPGTMNETILPFLQESSRRHVGEDLGLCYNPEFMALGSVVDDYLIPEFRIIGESDKKAGDLLESIYNDFYHKSEIYRMSLRNAELAKIANNAYVLTKISFANTIAEICEKMPTGDAHMVLDAVGADSRIGKRFLKPGLSYGGPCLPRDAKAFAYAANKYHSQAYLPETAEVINLRWIKRMTDILKEVLFEENTDEIAVLGLTYKTDTASIEESAPFLIVQNLTRWGVAVRVYDPSFKWAHRAVSKETGMRVKHNVKQCLWKAKVCFIATPWDEFKNMKKKDFISSMAKNPVVIDACGCNIHLKKERDIDYRRMGTESIRGNP